MRLPVATGIPAATTSIPPNNIHSAVSQLASQPAMNHFRAVARPFLPIVVCAMLCLGHGDAMNLDNGSTLIACCCLLSHALQLESMQWQPCQLPSISASFRPSHPSLTRDNNLHISFSNCRYDDLLLHAVQW